MQTYSSRTKDDHFSQSFLRSFVTFLRTTCTNNTMSYLEELVTCSECVIFLSKVMGHVSAISAQSNVFVSLNLNMMLKLIFYVFVTFNAVNSTYHKITNHCM